jgi:hypothetical protein
VLFHLVSRVDVQNLHIVDAILPEESNADSDAVEAENEKEAASVDRPDS